VIPPGPTSTWAKELVGENDNSAAKARGVRKRFVLAIGHPYTFRLREMRADTAGTLKKKIDRSSNRDYIPFMPFILPWSPLIPGILSLSPIPLMPLLCSDIPDILCPVILCPFIPDM